MLTLSLNVQHVVTFNFHILGHCHARGMYSKVFFLERRARIIYLYIYTIPSDWTCLVYWIVPQPSETKYSQCLHFTQMGNEAQTAQTLIVHL